MLDRLSTKVVSLERLEMLIGARPRPRSVVLCHGVFDVVHPGHIRHLLCAKARADVLVCAVTADAHVPEAPNRPRVPQELRAENLALLSVVDYVVVVDAPGPEGLLEALRPDFYAKGFEYSPDPRAQPARDAAVVEAYGGQVLFTPGDAGSSPSALLAASPPDQCWERLGLLMHRSGLLFDDLRRAVASLRGLRAHVVGDSIMDVLLRCEMVGSTCKTPTISVRRGTREEFVGGAGAVARHARAAGADVWFSTVLGKDEAAALIEDNLRAAGVRVTSLAEPTKSTTIKEVVVVGGQRLLKLDTVDNRPISDAVVRRLRESLRAVRAAAVMFSDFRHGVFHARSIPALVSAVGPGVLRAADSQVASRWGNILDFRGLELLAPNEREARFALGNQDSGVRPLAVRLRAEARCRYLILKLGACGLLAVESDDAARPFALDAFADAVLDSSGAGDALLAYASLALAAKNSLPAAAIIGSFAAGAACRYDGNAPVSSEQVLAKIDEAEREVDS